MLSIYNCTLEEYRNSKTWVTFWQATKFSLFPVLREGALYANSITNSWLGPIHLTTLLSIVPSEKKVSSTFAIQCIERENFFDLIQGRIIRENSRFQVKEKQDPILGCVILFFYFFLLWTCHCFFLQLLTRLLFFVFSIQRKYYDRLSILKTPGNNRNYKSKE